MAKKQLFIVKNSETDPLPTEVIAQSIKAVADGVRKIRSSGLTDRGLFVLIQHAAPPFSNGRRLSLAEVSTVFDGIEALERTYLKPKKKEGDNG